MKHLLPAALALSICFPALAEDQAPPAGDQPTPANGPVRPDDPEAALPLSDGLAECASILAVASSKSQNIVERNALENAAATWFAVSGDLAIEEGELPEVQVWHDKAVAWAGRIGSVSALSRHGDWMSYCAGIGPQRGLDASIFVAHAT